jgi:TrmH family RNA methyltransferase
MRRMSGHHNGRIDRFRRARRDRDLAVIEGFHALKHALRFDAEVLEVVCVDLPRLKRLASELAPDLGGRLLALAHPVEPAVFAQLAPRAARTGVIALAKRSRPDLGSVLADPRPAPIVLLEQPRDLNNVGACIRVAAAAEAAGVIVTGRHDPWHADAIRGGAGLHYALPVLWCPQLPDSESGCLPSSERPLVALDPDGDDLDLGELPHRALLAFGSERQGLSDQLLQAATHTLRIPMRAGVSSLNLATSVAAVLFATRLCPPAGTPSGAP